MARKKKSKKLINSILSMIIVIIIALISQNQEIQNYISDKTSNTTSEKNITLSCHY